MLQTVFVYSVHLLPEFAISKELTFLLLATIGTGAAATGRPTAAAGQLAVSFITSGQFGGIAGT